MPKKNQTTSVDTPVIRKRVTIRDLAIELNLSNRAVSQALNPRECSVKVSPETIKRVQELALKKGYRPDSRARSMRYGKFFNIGYFEAKLGPTDLPLPGAQSGVYEVASNAGYRVILIELPAEQTVKIPHVFREEMLDVLILSHAGNLPQQLVEQIDSSGYPVVYLNEKRTTNAIYSNDIKGAEIITQHLIDQGHKRIACLSYPSKESNTHYSVGDRIQGYQNAIRDAGLPSIIIDLGEQHAESDQRLRQWFEANKDSVDAIMCTSDFCALKAMRVLYDYRALFPGKISIAGYDNLARVLSALPLTTMHLSFHEMGKAAAKMAIELTDSPMGKKQSVSITPELIIRQSTTSRD